MYFVKVKCILLNVYGLAQFCNRFRKDMILSDFSGIPDSIRTRPNGSGRVRGATTLLVSEPRFRRFYKMIFKLFVNDFEILYNMHLICT